LPVAIAQVRTLNEENAYLFIDDDAGHFLSETVLTIIACTLMQSFLLGFIQEVNRQSAGLGSDLAKRLANGVKAATRAAADAVVARSTATTVTAEVQKSADTAREAVARQPDLEVDRYADVAEAALITALRDQGYTLAAARRVAQGVRQCALAVIQQ